MSNLILSIKEFIKPTGTPSAIARRSILKRQKLFSKVDVFLPYLRTVLLIAGFIYILLLPAKFLGRGHYVSENALQPAQVNTYWNWADVHVADQYAKDVEKWVEQGLSGEARAEKIRKSFESMGLRSSTQSYSFKLGSSNQTVSGVNVHSILQAPKTDGAEAIILSASWLSRAVDENGNRKVNVRGIAIVLALANYLMKSSMWSKDIIFLISDGYSDGTQAWLDSYQGYGQTNLVTESLTDTTGSIWIALNIDYPHHSFSHVGLYYEGVNGHLPNLDYINAITWIVRHSHIPVVLHSATIHASADLSIFTSTPLAPYLDNKIIREFERASRNLWYQLGTGAVGGANGPESVYGRYRIDALTLFGIEGEGPYGFHDFGNIIESIFRSLNNLLERFHQSFFLYIMTSVDTFITVGNYLAAPILISAAMTISGLTIWGEASGPTSTSVAGGLKTGGTVLKFRRPVGPAVLIIGITHVIGVGLFWFITNLDPTSESFAQLPTTFIATLFFTPVFLSYIITPATSTSLPTAPLSSILKSLNLILGGLSIAVVATLNFGASIAISLILSLPLILTRPIQSEIGWRLQQALLVLISPFGVWSFWRMVINDRSADDWLRETLMGYAIEGGWSLGLAVMVVVPLILQSATAALM